MSDLIHAFHTPAHPGLKKKKKKADCFSRKEKRATLGHAASPPGEYSNI